MKQFRKGLEQRPGVKRPALATSALHVLYNMICVLNSSLLLFLLRLPSLLINIPFSTAGTASEKTPKSNIPKGVLEMATRGCASLLELKW